VQDACSQKVSKNPKIVCAQVTLTKTGLSAVRTFSPLGVKEFTFKVSKNFFFGPQKPSEIVIWKGGDITIFSQIGIMVQVDFPVP
jgi:hypothetical protein